MCKLVNLLYSQAINLSSSVHILLNQTSILVVNFAVYKMFNLTRIWNIPGMTKFYLLLKSTWTAILTLLILNYYQSEG